MPQTVVARRRPDHAGQYAEREKRPPDANGRRRYIVDSRQRRQPVKDRAESFQFQLALLHEIHNAGDEDDEEGCISED